MSGDMNTDLINGELDGTNTREQSEELRTWFESHPDEKAKFEEMRRLVQTMESQDFAEPPAGHLERTLSSIPFRDPRNGTHEASEGWLSWLSGAFSRPALRFAGVFGIGLVVGAVVWSSVADRSRGEGFDYKLDISKISGTMKHISNAEGFARVGELAIGLEEVQGSVRLHKHVADGTLLADVILHSDTPIEWELEYSADEVSFEGFRRFNRQEADLTATASQTRSSHEGDGRYVLFFSTRDRLEAPITVRVYSSRKLVFEELITKTVE